jgi:predicted TIM-barrel fold metal-dependent hydrolase
VVDSKLLSAIFSAYNDFCAEFCTANPKRLKGIAFLNVDDVQDAVRELERCAKMGMIGVAIPVFNERMRYDMPEFDPLWAAAEANEMPISLHISTNRPSENNAELGRELFRTIGDVTNASDKTQPLFLQYLLVNGDYWARQSLGDMILSGVFERFPNLHVGAVETEMAWAVHWLRMIDLHYTDTPPGNMGYRFKNEMLPSDFFRRNCFIDTQEDFQGIKLREQIGVDNILWGNDYPHMESTFPKSMEFLSEMLKDCTEKEKEKISGGNAARIYRI